MYEAVCFSDVRYYVNAVLGLVHITLVPRVFILAHRGGKTLIGACNVSPRFWVVNSILP